MSAPVLAVTAHTPLWGGTMGGRPAWHTRRVEYRTLRELMAALGTDEPLHGGSGGANAVAVMLMEPRRAPARPLHVVAGVRVYVARSMARVCRIWERDSYNH